MIRKTLIATAAAVTVLGGTATALAVTTGSSGKIVFNGCEGGSQGRTVYDVFSNGTVPTCPSGAWHVSWSQTGPQGPQGPAGPPGTSGASAPLESSRVCTPDLCIDDAPDPAGSSGSGGWGWDSTTNSAVTSVAVGQSAPMTVTVLQPNTEQADGSITVTWDPYDFSLASPPTDGTCTAIGNNTETCSYTDLSHSAKSVAFTFTAQHPNPNALVDASVVVNGEQASAQFPISITKS